MKANLFSSPLSKIALSTALVASTLSGAWEARADGYCTHGRGIINEDGSSTTATILIRADFDGDGLTDKLCKDVRMDDSNGNRLLEWLVLGNGTTAFAGVWNEWCTHRNSRVGTVRRGGRSILTCTDSNRNYWERTLP